MSKRSRRKNRSRKQYNNFKVIKNTNVNVQKANFKKDTKTIITDGITPRNELLEKICFMTQYQLKDFLSKNFEDKELVEDDGFLFIKGSLPILLVAHLDTVHKQKPSEIVYANGTISSPQGIGADDRAGIYMILEILKHHDCSVLFCEDEEIGCVGSGKFCVSELAQELKGKFNYLIEVDRTNAKDAVFYQCDNEEFADFITAEHFELAYGSYTDIVELSPVLEAASVNFSCGYYKAHTTDEYLVLDEMETNIKEICKLIARTDMEKDKYEFVEADTDDWFKYVDNLYSYNSSHSSSAIGYGNSAYYIAFYNTDGLDEVQEIFANSQEEAIGMFLMTHVNMSFSDILGVMDEDEYYEYCELYKSTL